MLIILPSYLVYVEHTKIMQTVQTSTDFHMKPGMRVYKIGTPEGIHYSSCVSLPHGEMLWEVYHRVEPRAIIRRLAIHPYWKMCVSRVDIHLVFTHKGDLEIVVRSGSPLFYYCFPRMYIQ